MKPQNDNEPLLDGDEVPRELWDSPPISADFRESVFARTAAQVRGRSRRRRLAVGSGLVAVAYVGGIVTAFLAFQPAPPKMGTEPPVAVASDATVHEPALPDQALVTDSLLRDPEAFSLLIARSPIDKQIEILKAAGDRYLNGFGDIDQAMNCYRRMLSLQQPQTGVAMNVDDSWLLKSMKQARLREDTHEDATT